MILDEFTEVEKELEKIALKYPDLIVYFMVSNGKTTLHSTNGCTACFFEELYNFVRENNIQHLEEVINPTLNETRH